LAKWQSKSEEDKQPQLEEQKSLTAKRKRRKGVVDIYACLSAKITSIKLIRLLLLDPSQL
jgi:hypothetical protein